MKRSLVFLIYILISGCSDIPENIAVEKINQTNISARLISKSKNTSRPLVIVVPGSGGSYIPNKKLYGLVFSGYDVLSIAYFGESNLPQKIELIPLEYLKEVVLWSKKKFPERKIVLLGISKGAEYSLAFASNYDLIDGLICYSPSSFILPNHIGVQKKESQKSSWSLHGNEVPFARLSPFNDPAGKIVYKNYITPIFNNAEQIKKSRIQVENSMCHILLLSGEDDLVWPSYKMANLIKSEAEKNKQERILTHISYKDCGHQFVWFDQEVPQKRTEYQSMNLTGIKKHKFLYGGTQEGTINAMINSRIQVLRFLEKLSSLQ
ncbi:acyl-CoA thioester hydrolase/BAAT C-terminal domain-containing protein [Dokdonia sp.]|uniref:acyl-CoA thioester hydrolase/BAAT C-terminal domain-containing protein n=1 Tax=Dokdonia sp. TaxID=2024995 RepID=UPI0032651717